MGPRRSHLRARSGINHTPKTKREFPRIMRLLQELHMGFIFQGPSECNISVVREFYANWKPDAHSHFVTVRDVEVPLTPSAINQILGTTDASSNIRHALCGAQSTAKWIQHRHRGYYQLYPYAHMNREARVAAFYRGDERSKKKGPENMHGPTLTTAERNRRDDMITTRMFRLEMLRHRNGYQASSQEQLDEIAMKYPLNEYAEVLLGLELAFLEPVFDDVPTDEDKRRTMSDSEFDSDEEEGDLLALEGTNGDANMDE
ncbi:hypothetical protein H5410_004958 [Solanum commersonii]|uniref:Putative plant transposon protein domain-containing protein n=1 Tax=Solanum commersonii TaxID=4109 RepID=A0A9J6A6B3_SOLCO|nr:hypothetical protein H5410_004958 [Solanum commersonii]